MKCRRKRSEIHTKVVNLNSSYVHLVWIGIIFDFKTRKGGQLFAQPVLRLTHMEQHLLQNKKGGTNCAAFFVS
jgi:hypothetical protein